MGGEELTHNVKPLWLMSASQLASSEEMAKIVYSGVTEILGTTIEVSALSDAAFTDFAFVFYYRSYWSYGCYL